MQVLYHGGGATVREVFDAAVSDEQWSTLLLSARKLLLLRGHQDQAEFLASFPFRLLNGTNDFQDEFCVLYAKLPLDQYTYAIKRKQTGINLSPIAETLKELGHFTRFIAIDPELVSTPDPVPVPTPRILSPAVDRALADAETLLRSRGAASALDRVHTALHGCLRAIGQNARVELAQDASLTEIFKILRTSHPMIVAGGARGSEISRVLFALANVVDSLNTLRNRASGAHPNEVALEEPEAMLAINAVRTLWHYLDSKVQIAP